MSAIEPVVASVTVPCDPARAFAVFTDGIDRWWPIAGHSIGGEREVEAIVLEPALGGRLLERWRVGQEHPWGEVTAWEPPARFACTWRPSLEPGPSTTVEVAFEAVEGGTLVRLTHTGWEVLGDEGRSMRDRYDAGWSGVLTRFLDGTLGPVAHRAFARATNGQAWQLLGSIPLDDDGVAALLAAAHASAYHWSVAGGVVEQARADWLVSRAHVVAGDASAALRHARRSAAACESSPAEFADFDHAYAAEGLWRAFVLAGDVEEAARWRAKAEQLGAALADPEDRAVFEADLGAEL